MESSSCPFLHSDRTCTVLNVEGDAFGAGILQHFVDKNAKAAEAPTELSEVRLEDAPASAALEDSPLIQKKRPEGDASAHPDDRESIM